MITFNLNDRDRTTAADPDTPLLYVLRGEFELNGAKYGCGLGQCGACTVMVDNQAVFSCLMPVAALEGRRVRTVEGLGSDDQPSPVQRAFMDEQAAQCGYCTAGMVMRAQALLRRNPTPTDPEIRAHMAVNLCRCGTHMRILAAVRRAAAAIVTARATGAQHYVP
jgi:aerobic-type carbon monoxide dehydrogenase small subunit (CoxS/CutS family)